MFEANIGIVYFLTILRRTNEKESEYHHIVILIPEGALFYPTLVSIRAASSCCPRTLFHARNQRTCVHSTIRRRAPINNFFVLLCVISARVAGSLKTRETERA